MQNFDREDDEPLDPAIENVRQKMAKLQLVSLLIMFAGLAAVFAVIIYKVWYEPSDEPQIAVSTDAVPGAKGQTGLAAIELDQQIELPDGAVIVNSNVSGNRILLHLELNGGIQLWIYDLASQSLVSKVQIQ